VIPPGAIHVGAAIIAIVVGALMFASPKGTRRHRRLGYLYVAAMVNVNLAAWTVDSGGVVGTFHVLTIVSLATLFAAYAVIVTGRRSDRRSEAHGILMAWSYAGAVSAGLGQAAVVASLSVGAVIGGSLALAAVIIHVVRPGALRLDRSAD